MDLLAAGFLPTRGSYIVDAVFVGMFLISAAMVFSIYLVRSRRQFQAHRKIQTTLAVVLAAAIVLFEIDIRLINDWRPLAEESSFYASGWVGRTLAIHLVFAIPTPFVWLYVVVQAIRKFSNPPVPSEHSRSHRFWGRIAAGLIWMTSITGCVFYCLAFAW